MPIAIVTGGNSGIGRATAVAFAEQGYDVGITWNADESNRDEALEELREHGVKVASRQMDLSEGSQATRAIGELIDELGGVDVFVNNAGTGHSQPFLEHDLEAFREILEVDLVGAFACAQKAARAMVAAGRGGRMTGQEDQDPSESERPGVPVGRPGHAREIASAIVWLASPDARYATGQSFVIDGGMLPMPAVANQMASGH